jgi:hypothetical protein
MNVVSKLPNVRGMGCSTSSSKKRRPRLLPSREHPQLRPLYSNSVDAQMPGRVQCGRVRVGHKPGRASRSACTVLYE